MTTPNTQTANVNLNDVKVDPVAWAKRGNKIVFGNVAGLTPDPTMNIRHRAGTEAYGVKVEKDTYDLPGMKAGIVEMVGIQEPILVSVRKIAVSIADQLAAKAAGKEVPKETEEMVPLRGNRRTFAGQELLADSTISADLRKALTERTPMILLYGLTREQESELIQDQTQKPFLRSEVIKHIFKLRQNKWTFDRIAMTMWETLGRFSGNHKKLAEVRDIQDAGAKATKVKTWLRGTLDNYIIWGYDLGEFVRKCILLSEMKLDGSAPDTAEKPYFITTKDSQKRIGELKKAKELDGTKWNGVIPVEGSEFKKVLDKFHAADYGTKPTTTPTSGPKMMQRKDLEGIKDSFSSQAVKAMIDRVLGNTVPNLSTADEFAGQMETKMMLVENYLPRLNPPVADVLRLVFVNPDATDFQAFLESNCVSEAVKNEGTATDQAESGNEFKLGEGDDASADADATADAAK